MNNPDFIGVPNETAIDDFKKRIEKYQEVYEEVSENDYKVIWKFTLGNFVCKIHKSWIKNKNSQYQWIFRI